MTSTDRTWEYLTNEATKYERSGLIEKAQEARTERWSCRPHGPQERNETP